MLFFLALSHAQKIIDRHADYLIGLKGNQGNFHAAVKNFFEQARNVDYEDTHVTSYLPTPEKSHGRVYTWEVYYDPNYLRGILGKMFAAQRIKSFLSERPDFPPLF
ncbi:MAG: hypothetical protein AAGI90_03745 [Chlamydiota bacterium]